MEMLSRLQDYGAVLAETVKYFGSQAPEEQRHIQTSPSASSTILDELDESSSLNWLSWKNFCFNTAFAHLAPRTSQELRIYAKQAAKLIDWIRDSRNDSVFRAWQGLDQVVDSPQSESARIDRESSEKAALEYILNLESPDLWCPGTTGEESGRRPESARLSEYRQGAFALYISQEALRTPHDPYIGEQRAHVSGTFSLGGTDEETRGNLSADNHWRRTILG